MKDFEEYLLENIEKGVIDHSVRASIDERGNISFYIHANGHDSDTLDYWVRGDKLISKRDFKYEQE